jgi:hypothetical protein
MIQDATLRSHEHLADFIGEDVLGRAAEHAAFEGREGQAFSVRLDPVHTVTATLIEVNTEEREHTEGFDLVFEVAHGDAFPQGLYKVEPEDGAPMALFLTPIVAMTAGTRHYQSVVTRLKEGVEAAGTPPMPEMAADEPEEGGADA